MTRGERDTVSDVDDVFSVLSNHRRRYALHACERFGTPISLSDLSEHVASWEYDKERDGLTSEERRRVYTSMQQTHLPAMEDAGVIRFDGREVELTDRGRQLDVYMEVVPGNSIPWGDYYLGLSLISAAVVGGIFLGVYPESVPDVAWAAIIVVAFGLSSAYHSYRSRRMRLGIPEKPPEIGGGSGPGGDGR